jgi:hypothetical protein
MPKPTIDRYVPGRSASLAVAASANMAANTSFADISSTLRP